MEMLYTALMKSSALLLISSLLYTAIFLWRASRSRLNAAKAAHWSAKYSGRWIQRQRLQLRDTAAVHEAHLRHGPVVRLGPSEISVNDIDAGVKLIYEARMPKTDWYQFAVSYGAESMFAISNEKQHMQRKKLVAKPYLKSSLMNNLKWHKQLANLAEDLSSCLLEATSKRPDVELYDVFFAWSLASVSGYTFGPAGCQNFIKDPEGARRVREAYESDRLNESWASSHPILSRYRQLTNARSEIEIRLVREMQCQAEGGLSSVQSDGAVGAPQSVYVHMKGELLRAIPLQDAKTQQLPALENAIILSEMQDHIVAGIETSAAFLATCAWLMSLEHNAHWQEKLRREVRPFREGNARLETEELPTLEAIIKETLRLYPPSAGCQPRLTTKTVILGPKGHEVEVPPNTIVHAQAWTLHRNGGVFESPEAWLPERWLESSPEKKRQMDRWFWAFGSGSRRCIGQDFAMINLKVAVATIWTEFETRVTDRTKFTLSSGVLAAPISNDGQYLRLAVNELKD